MGTVARRKPKASAPPPAPSLTLFQKLQEELDVWTRGGRPKRDKRRPEAYDAGRADGLAWALARFRNGYDDPDTTMMQEIDNSKERNHVDSRT